MTLTQAGRDIRAVIEQIKADFTAYPLKVEIDNRSTVDQATQTDPYLKVEIDYLPGGQQLSIGTDVVVRQVGQVCLYAIVKEGAGTDLAAQLLDFVVPYFDRKVLGSVHLHPAQAIRGRPVKGWWYAPALLEFWYDRLTT